MRLRLRLTVPSLRPGDVVVPSCQTAAARREDSHRTLREWYDMPQHTAVATLHTNHGDIVVNLFGDHAPRTVQNFIGLSDGTKDWTDPATGKPGEGPALQGRRLPPHHPGLHDPGRRPARLRASAAPATTSTTRSTASSTFTAPYKLAMANAGLRRNAITGKAEGTNGSQFFITVPQRPRPEWLQGKHTIFGEVADDASKAVVDAIAERAHRRGRSPHRAGRHPVRSTSSRSRPLGRP